MQEVCQDTDRSSRLRFPQRYTWNSRVHVDKNMIYWLKAGTPPAVCCCNQNKISSYPFSHSGSSPRLPVLFFCPFHITPGRRECHEVHRSATRLLLVPDSNGVVQTELRGLLAICSDRFSSCCIYFCVPQVNQARKPTDNLLEIESLLFVIMFFLFIYFLRRPIYSSGTSKPTHTHKTHTHTQVWNPSTANHRTRPPTREGGGLIRHLFLFPLQALSGLQKHTLPAWFWRSCWIWAQTIRAFLFLWNITPSWKTVVKLTVEGNTLPPMTECVRRKQTPRKNNFSKLNFPETWTPRNSNSPWKLQLFNMI